METTDSDKKKKHFLDIFFLILCSGMVGFFGSFIFFSLLGGNLVRVWSLVLIFGVSRIYSDIFYPLLPLFFFFVDSFLDVYIHTYQVYVSSSYDTVRL